MLQVPDAAQDSFGQLHIRGDHNGLQFRLNGVILPDGISVFGQTLPPRMIASMKLITGSLPAEYGLRSAGIIDLTTKGGALQPGGDVSLYGWQPRCDRAERQLRRTTGSNTYFVTGDTIGNGLGIESPDGRPTPLHDHTSSTTASAISSTSSTRVTACRSWPGAPTTASRFRTAPACTPPTSVRDSRSTGRRIT